jgi:signal transduction histidine kinase
MLNHVDGWIKTNNYKELRSKFYFARGVIFFTKGDNSKAVAIFDSTSQILSPEVDKQLPCDLYYYWGSALRGLGRMKLAEIRIGQSLKQARELNSPALKARALRELGIISYHEGSYSESINYCQEALKWYYEVDDKKGRAAVYNILSMLNKAVDNNQLALELLDKANEIYLQLNDKNGLATTMLNRGVIFDRMQEYDKAHQCFKSALESFKDAGNQQIIPLLYNNIGSIYGKIGRLDSAMILLNEAIRRYELLGNLKGKASTLHSKGKIYCDLKEYTKAIESMNQALELSEEIGAQTLKISILTDLALCYQYSKQYEQAYITQKKLTELKNLVWDDKSNSQIAELEVLYHTELKERENTELRYQNEVIIKQNTIQKIILIASLCGFFILGVLIVIIYLSNKALKAKNREIVLKQEKIERQNKALASQKNMLIELSNDKDRFFSIATQNLYEPVGTIYKLLEHTLQIQTKGSKEDLHAFIKTSKEASVQAFNLLENLYYWARIQQGHIDHDPAPHLLKPLLEHIIMLQQPKATAKMIIIRLLAENDNVGAYFDAKLIEIALRNLIENAVKFSTRGGEVNVKLWSDGIKSWIRISDSGVGMTREQLEALFSRRFSGSVPGTHGEKGGGLGLILTKNFIDRNMGTIKVESSIAEGTTVLVSLPSNRNKLI